MRIAQLLALSGLMLMSNVAIGAELEHEDVPDRCWRYCGQVVGIAHKCDHMYDNDAAEMRCICDWRQAPSLVPLCEACIAQYRSEDNKAHDILTSCSFSAIGYNPTAAVPTVSSTGTSATDAIVTTTATATPAGISDSTNSGSSANSDGNLASNTNSATSALNTENAASSYSSSKAASLAAVVGLGFLAWL
ncbi:hypothetical protein BDV26DRAFT_1260 [Aspergillus bertholletiae]|uniref:GPI anchored protein n=1 Tax=Aspergillus bertholletiae TaxID=1226010 RepID=A0A5N7BPK7_9EURO|nr:hypothetical protein BDV26DRAFT_1260 [Aspergillus bertholletiae]